MMFIIKAGETKDNYDILLYDQDFIDDNFESYDNLQGVFTVNQVNIEIQKKIDALSEEKIQTTEAMSKLIEEGNKKKSLEASLLTQLQEECWKRSATIREDFDGTMSGKKRKNSFADKILATAPAAHDIKKLKELYDVAYDANSQAYDSFKKSKDISGRYDLSGEELMAKPIISSSDTQFAVFMRTIGATDWVKNGHAIM